MARKSPISVSTRTTNYSNGVTVERTTQTVRGKNFRSEITDVSVSGQSPVSYGQAKGLVGSFFKLVVVLLLFCMCLRTLNGASIPTFSDLLSLLSRAPVIPSDWLSFFNPTSIEGNPFPIGVILWNFIKSVLGFGASMSVIGINLLLYLGYFLSWLFIPV